MNRNDLTMFFITQPGVLSFKSRLLAASLRRFAPEGVKLVACVPAHLNKLDALTVGTFDRLGVQIKEFNADLWSKYNYPIGNKLDASVLDFSTRYAMFLDSDMLAMRKLEIWRLPDCAMSARSIMGRREFTLENAPVLKDFLLKNCKLDESAFANASDDGFTSEVGFPVYNSGLVIFDVTSGFQHRWRELTCAVLENEQLPKGFKYPLADQTALAATALEIGSSFTLLKNVWNMNINVRKKVPFIYHYFGFMRLFQDKNAFNLVKELQKESSKLGLPILGEIGEKDLVFTGQ
ncbi:hypothetical protein M2360_002658 [Rhizobium sp. SG_E_25_P2]|uniref:hypothetical protein n=1 Tax=Rhizobium sp. SG_E_25_P2 TaxID=2879942 RepID=UPI002475901A|nr:hypothetical protein [Rhizobium sp. SG_E_25_P2]MDH6267261.1 hypothetical protein [Rhizobium sp. SG_E_25_P2]